VRETCAKKAVGNNEIDAQTIFDLCFRCFVRLIESCVGEPVL
jgi:hypothetical protein